MNFEWLGNEAISVVAKQMSRTCLYLSGYYEITDLLKFAAAGGGGLDEEVREGYSVVNLYCTHTNSSASVKESGLMLVWSFVQRHQDY